MNVAALIKESAGFFGSLMIAFPWIRDYVGRVRATEIDPSRFLGGLNRLGKALNEKKESWLRQPKLSDFLMTVIGLGLLVLGFAIGVVQAVAESPPT